MQKGWRIKLGEFQIDKIYFTSVSRNPESFEK